MKSPPKANRDKALYTQTKKTICADPRFFGLAKLAMWYGYCLTEKLAAWEHDWKKARMGEGAVDKAILTIHPHGYTFRRILTDGTLLQVYDDDGSLSEESLLPIALLGANGILMEIDEVPGFILEHGGYRARFCIEKSTHTGYLLPGKKLWGAWDEENKRGRFFEAAGSKNPNGKMLERLT